MHSEPVWEWHEEGWRWHASYMVDTSMPTHAMTKTTFRPALCGLLRCSLSLMDMNPNYGKGFLF